MKIVFVNLFLKKFHNLRMPQKLKNKAQSTYRETWQARYFTYNATRPRAQASIID